MSNSTPTWIFRPDGGAKIVNLTPGEALPSGWFASPACIVDPELATAEALSASAEGRPYETPAFDAVSGFRVDHGAGAAVDPNDLANALAEVGRLQGIIAAGTAENARLVAEIEEAERTLDAAATDIAALRVALDAAGAEKADLLAKVDGISAELATARADLDALTAPAAGKAGK